jgi:catechol 2,3-dioxygenase-like lactoylglutathione lyase family enzyme
MASALGDAESMATVAVRDLGRARRFYEEVLGLQAAFAEEPHMAAYTTGRSKLLVYVSQFAGTNRATSVTWNVGAGVDELVRTLRGRGATFEHYDLPDTRREGDVHVSGARRVAWLKDPDGNILALASD